MIRRALLAMATVALFACASKYERGGKCWTEPSGGGSPMQCPPPGVWWSWPGDEDDIEDAGTNPDAGDDSSVDGGHA